ncbi:MAG TPA: hypothetical protein VNH19_02285 [Candidatus Limnocylindrales bacterium]|nr:hypothetical protein [Candidatus Limnocylindrales bacterium]
MRVVIFDAETYFDPKDFTLSKMSTEEYIRDPRFEAHGAAIKWQHNIPAKWYAGKDLEFVLKQEDWSDVLLVAHHCAFDGLILSHHYNVHPKMLGCTMSMFRLLFGNHMSASLDSVRKYFGIPAKITPYNLFSGKRWHEIPPDHQQLVGEGACDEVESIWNLFGRLAKDFPPEEFEVMSTVLKMFTEPVLRADTALLGQIWEMEENNKNKRAAMLGVTEADLQSADRFKQLLEDAGVEVEYKQGKNGPIPAFAKTDDFMRELLEDPDDYIRGLAECRLKMKSTLLQTRAERLGWTSSRGALPVYLNYSGAGTLRVSGGDKVNWLNFTRQTSIKDPSQLSVRKTILAPEEYVLMPLDSSQIECVAEGQKVLTEHGSKAIEDVTINDRVWDGQAFVEHEGVIFKGIREVISYQGLTATPTHVIYPRGNRYPQGIEMRVAAALGVDIQTSYREVTVRKTSLRSSDLCRVQNLWSTRNPVSIQKRARFSFVGTGEFTTSDIPWSRDRSDQQQWPLSAGQFEAFNSTAKRKQSLHHLLGAFSQRFETCYARFYACISSLRLWTRSNKAFSRKRINWRANNSSISNFLPPADVAQTKTSWIQTPSWLETKKAKVYDIVNAGPRYRFMAEGVIVSNCRVLHYLAGGPEEPVIQTFRTGADPYVGLASKFYKEEIYKPKKGDPRFDEMEAKRGMGKQGRLMCGYGASGKAFKRTAKNGLYGPSVEISIEDANTFVKLYRSDNPPITAKGTGYWAQCDRMIARLAGGPPIDWGPLHVRDHRIYLPNGCPLVYDTMEFHRPNADEEIRDFEEEGYWRVKTKQGWKKMWGSKLTQNICEAVSRVIISQAMIRITRMGYRVLNWPYDELLILIPKDGKEQWHLDRCKVEMVREVPWLPGLPLDVEGTFGERYSK